MVTEKEYLAAVEVIRNYHRQIEAEIKGHEINALAIVLNGPTKGDRIKITQAFGGSKYLIKGSEHIVSWSRPLRDGSGLLVKLSAKGTGRKHGLWFNTDNYSFEIIEKYPISIPSK